MTSSGNPFRHLYGAAAIDAATSFPDEVPPCPRQRLVAGFAARSSLSAWLFPWDLLFQRPEDYARYLAIQMPRQRLRILLTG